MNHVDFIFEKWKSFDAGVDSVRSGGWCYAGKCVELVFLLSGSDDF